MRHCLATCQCKMSYICRYRAVISSLFANVRPEYFYLLSSLFFFKLYNMLLDFKKKSKTSTSVSSEKKYFTTFQLRICQTSMSTSKRKMCVHIESIYYVRAYSGYSVNSKAFFNSPFTVDLLKVILQDRFSLLKIKSLKLNSLPECRYLYCDIAARVKYSLDTSSLLLLHHTILYSTALYVEVERCFCTPPVPLHIEAVPLQLWMQNNLLLS